MRYWYDFEFLEDGTTIDPISVGVVAEDGREFYAVFEEIAEGRLYELICQHMWLMTNVVPHLPLVQRADRKPVLVPPKPLHTPRFELDRDHPQVLPAKVIRKLLLAFLTEGAGPIELWGWYAAYDHVALMQLWGPMVNRPQALPMFTRDLKQLVELAGGVELPKQATNEHDALWDARWTFESWRYVVRRFAEKSLALHL